MDLLNILSLSLFLIFFISYAMKLLVLYKRNGIKANVLARGGKSNDIDNAEVFVKITTFTWGGLWLIFSVIPSKALQFIGLIEELSFLRYIGILFSAIGVVIFIISMISMKASWRVGIDKNTATALVTSGIYKYSRNPAFVGFDIMFLGFGLTYPSILSVIVTMLNLLAIHKLILQEEKHLLSAFGDKYEDYRSKTARYFSVRGG